MNDDAVNLGALIKAKREEMSLTLREVENSTSIRSNFLKGIEEGRVCEMISGVYGLGFLRQYMQFLGLKVEEAVEEYPMAFRAPKEKQDFSYGLGTLEVRGGSSEGSKWFPNMMWVLLAGGVVVAAYFAAKHFGVL